MMKTLLACAALLLFAGCNQQSDAGARVAADDHGHEHAAGGDSHSHGAWWCDEHGVPEEICALCDPKVAAELKKKGDWCKEHDRPDSQCFVCHPELEGQFAARYEAKYGKKPPRPGS